MSVLIVIVNYGTAQMSLRAAESAVAAARELGGDWSLVIVDNKSPDDSVTVLREEIAARRAANRSGWQQVELLASEHNGGFGAGNNLAMRPALASASPPDYVYLLNSDAFPEPGALVALKRYMDQHPDVGVTGSHIQGTDGVYHDTAFRFPSLLSEFEDGIRLGVVSTLLARWRVSIGRVEDVREVDWVAGASMMLRTGALREVGLFDEEFFLYFEETELCLRIRRAGWKTVYVPASRVEHVGGATTGQSDSNRRRVPGYWLDSRYHYFTGSHGYAYMLLANLARAAGMSLFHLRRLVQRKENTHPPCLLRDLSAHFLRRSLGAGSGTPVAAR